MERDSPLPIAKLLAGRRALAILSRRAFTNRKRPPEDGEMIDAPPPDKPKPLIDGVEAPVE
jgi:hypothetical protein